MGTATVIKDRRLRAGYNGQGTAYFGFCPFGTGTVSLGPRFLGRCQCL